MWGPYKTYVDVEQILKAHTSTDPSLYSKELLSIYTRSLAQDKTQKTISDLILWGIKNTLENEEERGGEHKSMLS